MRTHTNNGAVFDGKRLPSLIAALLEISRKEQGLLQDLVLAVESGDQDQILKSAQALARQHEAPGDTPQNCVGDSR